MRHKLLFILLFISISGFGQLTRITDYSILTYTTEIPASLTNGRTAVFVALDAGREDGFQVEANWKSFSDEVHSYLYRMGIDPVFYINQSDYWSSTTTRKFYQELLRNRAIQNLLFVYQTSNGFELISTKLVKEGALVAPGQKAYKDENRTLKEVMLEFARRIKRADHPMENFLIPERPLFVDELSVVEKLTLKNYPGQIRRSRLAIERFSEIEAPPGSSDSLKQQIDQYNLQIQAQNHQLESIMQELPYEVVYIDHMSDEDLLRRRHQFVLRSLHASGETVRSVLNYKSETASSGYVSVIPIMPDITTFKTLPKEALVYKFYIRQNIAKNVYVGEWDADVTWQDALRNYIRNMMQYFNKGN